MQSKIIDSKLYHREYLREWRKNNPDKNKEYWHSENTQTWYKNYTQTEIYKEARFWIRIKNRYGLSKEQYWQMVENQQSSCAICGKVKIAGYAPDVPINDKLHIDHNNDTGKVRELLCHGCNSGMGHLQHQPDLLRNAASYLERHKLIGGDL